MSKAPISENGFHADAKMAPGASGRAADGKFAAGNKCAKGNPFGRRLAAMRQAVLDAVSEDDVRAIMAALVGQAKGGDVAAARVVLQYAVGKPAAAVEPDRVEIEEWRLREQGAVSYDSFMTTFGQTTAAMANNLVGTMQPALPAKMFEEVVAERATPAGAAAGAGDRDKAPSRDGFNGAARRRGDGSDGTSAGAA
jgi:hypothetical protein